MKVYQLLETEDPFKPEEETAEQHGVHANTLLYIMRDAENQLKKMDDAGLIRYVTGFTKSKTVSMNTWRSDAGMLDTPENQANIKKALKAINTIKKCRNKLSNIPLIAGMSVDHIANQLTFVTGRINQIDLVAIQLAGRDPYEPSDKTGLFMNQTERLQLPFAERKNWVSVYARQFYVLSNVYDDENIPEVARMKELGQEYKTWEERKETLIHLRKNHAKWSAV